MKTLIKNGIIVTDQEVFEEDLLIEDGKIVATGFFEEDAADEVYDAAHMFVMPGGIDPHTHMELQQSPKFRAVDDFYTGTVAAAVGGTTTILDHIGFGPKGCNLHHSINHYHEIAKKSVIDYGFHGVIQEVNDDILKELDSIVREEGIPSFKAYSTYGYPMSDLDFSLLLTQMKESKGLLTIHCENDAMTVYLKEKFKKEGKVEPIYHALSRPNETEAECVDTLLNLAAMAGDAPVYIVHTSAKESVDRIALARAQGQERVYSETCTQYLMLTDEKYTEHGPEEGTKYLMAPPLRKDADREVLWEAVREDVVNTIGTDHCPFLFETEKKLAAHDFTAGPGGAPGVEERMRIIFSEGVMKNRLSLQDFVRLTSTNSAKIFGMYPKKGSLAVGADADIVVIDPRKSEVLSVKNQKGACDYNAYEGLEVTGAIHLVFSRGKLVAKDNEFVGEKGHGQFIHRKIDTYYEVY